MKNTLIVNYTPREGSNTKRLVDSFLNQNKNKTNITFLDLAKDTPDLLLEENLNLYVKRNFGGLQLSDEEEQVLAKNDKLVTQVLAADYIVIATPMYNMSIPATVKAWIDAIIQAGKTFSQGPEGLKGLCEGKQGLVLMTSGSDFGVAPLSGMNYATTLLNACLGLIGIPTENITAFGLQQHGDRANQILDVAKEKINSLSSRWY